VSGATADGALVARVLLRPDAGAAGQARRVLRELVGDVASPDCVDAAELAVSEVVTNTTLHAHTGAELSIRLEAELLRVEVRDFNPAVPVQRSYGEQATTGRGMALVAAVTSSCGVTRLADGKVVWFVVPTEPQELSEDDLLAAFDDAQWDLDDPPPPAADPDPQRPVRLVGVPPTLWLVADEHHDALLRELALYLSSRTAATTGPDPGAADPLRADLARVDLAVADRGRQILSAALAAGIEQAVADRSAQVVALPAGHPSPLPPAPAAVDVETGLPAGLGADLAALQDALDTAEHLAATGALLAFPGQPEVVAVRDWVTEQVQAQLSGVLGATPWRGTAHSDFESTRRREDGAAALDAAVAFVRDDPRGVVAADEGNRLVAVSQVLASALGWEVDDLLGRRVVALIPPSLREAHVAGFTRHLSTGRAHVLGRSLTLPVLRADGSEVDCEFLIEQVPAPPGRSLYLAWITPSEPAGASAGA
jgi:PAS domain S-box-containing protein